MNLLDAAAAVVVLLGLAIGYRAGLARQLSGLVGGLAGVVAGLVLAAYAQDQLAVMDQFWRSVVVVGGLGLCLLVGRSIGSSLGGLLASGREPGAAGSLNRLVGGALGAAEALVIVWVVGGLLVTAPWPEAARQAHRSTVVHSLNQVVSPTTFVEQVQAQLAAVGLSDVITGLTFSPAEPTELPSNRGARAVAKQGMASTVKVMNSGCALQGRGSGVVVAPGYVVTNAHVVAGGSFLRVQGSGREHEAVPVLVDASLDVAVLHVPGFDAPALRFSDTAPTRGAQGVVLGYPGGGDLVGVRASVSRSMSAVGRDVHDQHQVTRPVLELRARVNPGNSGGPLVLMDGTVGGIVFAESPTDKRVGYALNPLDVSSVVLPAVGRTAPVRTGPCPARR